MHVLQSTLALIWIILSVNSTRADSCLLQQKNGTDVFKHLLLKQATQEEFPALHQILVDCGEHMHTHLSLNHWYPYATLEQFKEKVKAATIYCVYFDDRMIATFTLSTVPRAYYQPSHWRYHDANAVYLGNLAIHPDFQGKKIGSWCIQQIEKIAQSMGCSVIRFDCVQKHPWLCNFYEKMGYVPGAIIPMPEPTGNLVCFEKKYECCWS